MTFSEFLRDLIDEAKLSEREFAKKLGVAASTVSDYAAGRQGEPTLRFLRKLAKHTGKTMADLMVFAYPDDFPDAAPPGITAETLALAKELSKLSKEEFRLIKAVMRSLKDT